MSEAPAPATAEGLATAAGDTAGGPAAAAKRSGAAELLQMLIAQEIAETRVAITEENARKLFKMYVVDSESESLTPQDVRQLLLDLLDAFEWPLVVPDESLDAVFSEMSLNENGAITWVEFKSFFVFLQDRPLHKLFQLTANGITSEQLASARLALFTVVDPPPSSSSASAASSSEKPESAAVASSDPSVSDASSGVASVPRFEATYDRTPFERCIRSHLIPETERVFVYFISDRAALVLCISDRFAGPLAEPAKVRVSLELGGEESRVSQMYDVSIKAFDRSVDVFPPMRRFGGFGSKMARRLADTYCAAKSWDESHLKLADRTKHLARRASQKLAAFDAEYKVSEQINQAAQQASDSVKKFDEEHQISATITAKTKELDEKYKIKERTDETLKKIQENPTVKSVTTALSGWLAGARRSADQISSETRQLVTEKEKERATKKAAAASASSSAAEAAAHASGDSSGLANVVAESDIMGDTSVPVGEDSDEDVD